MGRPVMSPAVFWETIHRHQREELPRIFLDLRLSKPNGLEAALDEMEINPPSLAKNSSLQSRMYRILYAAYAIDESQLQAETHPLTRMSWELMKAASSHGGNNLSQLVTGLDEFIDEVPTAFERSIIKAYAELSKTKGR